MKRKRKKCICCKRRPYKDQLTKGQCCHCVQDDYNATAGFRDNGWEVGFPPI